MTKQKADNYWSLTMMPISSMIILGCYFAFIDTLAYLTTGVLNGQWWTSPLFIVIGIVMFVNSSRTYSRLVKSK